MRNLPGIDLTRSRRSCARDFSFEFSLSTVSAIEVESSFKQPASGRSSGHRPLCPSDSQSAWVRGNPLEQRDSESENGTTGIQCGSSNEGDASEISLAEKAAIQRRRNPSGGSPEILVDPSALQRSDDQLTWIHTVPVRSSSSHSSIAQPSDSRTSPQCLVLLQS